MTDKSGNTAEGKGAGKPQFQFHPPVIDQTTLLLSGSPVKNGGMVKVSFTLNRSVAKDTWEWDGVNWTQKEPAASPPAQRAHALAYDSVQEKVVLFGERKPFFLLFQ